MEEGLIAGLTERIRGSGASREVLVKRVANALRAEIAAGALKPGARLVNELSLAQSLEISRPTLREAIRILAREGCSTSSTVSAPSSADEHRLIWAGSMRCAPSPTSSASVGGARRQPSQRHARVPRSADVAEALDIAPGAPVALIDRVRLIDGDAARRRQRVRVLAEGRARISSGIKAFAGGSLYAFLRERLRGDAVALDRRHHGRRGRYGAGEATRTCGAGRRCSCSRNRITT